MKRRKGEWGKRLQKKKNKEISRIEDKRENETGNLFNVQPMTLLRITIKQIEKKKNGKDQEFQVINARLSAIEVKVERRREIFYISIQRIINF